MLRKTIIALAAIGTLSAAALAPTSASAWGGNKGWGGGGFHHYHGGYGRIGLGLGLVGAGIAYDNCMQKQWVDTPYGARLRWVNVCY